MRGAASFEIYDELPSSVRAALRATCFEMDPAYFRNMSEADALRWIRSIDSAVRAADAWEKR